MSGHLKSVALEFLSHTQRNMQLAQIIRLEQNGPHPQYGWDFPEEIPEKFRKHFRKNSGRNPLSERFLEFPSRVRLRSPKPHNSRHLRLPEHFQNSLLPQHSWVRLFFEKWFRRGRLRAGHGIPNSTGGISDKSKAGKLFCPQWYFCTPCTSLHAEPAVDDEIYDLQLEISFPVGARGTCLQKEICPGGCLEATREVDLRVRAEGTGNGRNTIGVENYSKINPQTILLCNVIDCTN